MPWAIPAHTGSRVNAAGAALISPVVFSPDGAAGTGHRQRPAGLAQDRIGAVTPSSAASSSDFIPHTKDGPKNVNRPTRPVLP